MLVLLFFLLPLSLAGAGVPLPLLFSSADRLRGPPETQEEGLPEADALPPAGVRRFGEVGPLIA